MKVHGLILAGGQGSRMGGVDKGLQLWQGKPLVSFAYKALSPLCECVVISCNRNADRYEEVSSWLFADQVAGFEGPLSGLVSAIHYLQANNVSFGSIEWLLVSPCDTPKVSSEDFKVLLDRATTCDAGLYALKGREKDHPLHCLIHHSKFGLIEQAFEGGARSVYRLFNELGVEWIEVSDEGVMANINALPES